MKYIYTFLAVVYVVSQSCLSYAAQQSFDPNIAVLQWHKFYDEPLDRELKELKDEFKLGDLLFKDMIKDFEALAKGEKILPRLVRGTELLLLKKAQEFSDTFHKNYKEEIAQWAILFDENQDSHTELQLKNLIKAYALLKVFDKCMLDDFKKMAAGENLSPRIVPTKKEGFCQEVEKIYMDFFQHYTTEIKKVTSQVNSREEEWEKEKKLSFGDNQEKLLEDDLLDRSNKDFLKHDLLENKKEYRTECLAAQKQGLPWYDWVLLQEKNEE